jgi:hypothetical protein
MRRFNNLLATALAMSIGFLMTVSLLIDGLGERVLALLVAFGVEPFVRSFAPTALTVITTTVALTIIIGLVNLLGVHFSRTFLRFRKDGLLSLLLVLSALAVIVVVITERTGQLAAPAGGPSYTTLLRNTVLFSIEASLAGLLAFSLIYGAVRLTRNRVSLEIMVFLLALVLALLVRAGAFDFIPVLAQNSLIERVGESLVNAGTIGIILGIALATLVAGVRVLIGQDRSFRD